MSKRKIIHPISTAAEADRVLAELAAARRDIGAIEREMQEIIDAAKAAASAQAEPIRVAIGAAEARLLDLANRVVDFAILTGGKKTLELAHGSLGRRMSAAVKPLPKWTWAKVLEQLIGQDELQAVQITHRPNKEVLATWSSEHLERVGARYVVKDEPWYEVNKDRLEDGL